LNNYADQLSSHLKKVMDNIDHKIFNSAKNVTFWTVVNNKGQVFHGCIKLVGGYYHRHAAIRDGDPVPTTMINDKDVLRATMAN
jgi:hypothetical protein